MLNDVEHGELARIVLGGRDQRGEVDLPPNPWDFNVRHGRGEAVFVTFRPRVPRYVASFYIVAALAEITDPRVQDHEPSGGLIYVGGRVPLAVT